MLRELHGSVLRNLAQVGFKFQPVFFLGDDGIALLGGGNSNIFYFHPEPWGRFPFWRSYFFKGIGSTTNQIAIVDRFLEVGSDVCFGTDGKSVDEVIKDDDFEACLCFELL